MTSTDTGVISNDAAGLGATISRDGAIDTVTLIGGPARVGKTTLARQWAAAQRADLVQLDNLLHAVAEVAIGKSLQALQKAPSIATHNPREWLAELRVRDEVLWKAAQGYLNKSQGALVMEGGLWPDWVASLERPHTALFIVDTDIAMADRLIDITRTDPLSWMAKRGYSEDKIRKWADYNRFRSEDIAERAVSHGYPVFDISGGIDRTQREAIRYLTDNYGRSGPNHEH